MIQNVYITRTSSFFPNQPVHNEEMEDFIGKIGGVPSRVRPIILRQNGIKTRYYALDRNQQITHTNAQMASMAINKLFQSEKEKEYIEVLTCGTSTPDQLLPSHASMVQGEAFKHPMEIYSLSGVCLTGVAALKTAYMSILCGNSGNAVCCTSELSSPTFLAKFYTTEYECLKEVEDHPYLAFDKDFLRYMLSDGSAALLLSENKPEGLSLKIEGIEMISYANEQPACMYMLTDAKEDGRLRSWKEFSIQELAQNSVWCCKQNVKLLNKYVIKYFVDAIEMAMDRLFLKDEEITYVIPHISSMYFYQRLADEISNRGIDLPVSKWFTNLTSVGNVGSVAPFAALDELLRTKDIKVGDRILLLVPESGRFSYGVVSLLAV
ncbi:StlD/DarB family beta-ketosynthase [uncultured Duncaniella sp.]|uniref:StlD/DarB family beta-ketosynthase n=1 Tax=uncultured Duncaniella sp. TaxID=2768039 RepID=UPI0025B72FDA|nr:StlD/DarB family beta-ketosynthase [uncultured Duncaniella sp.]